MSKIKKCFGDQRLGHKLQEQISYRKLQHFFTEYAIAKTNNYKIINNNLNANF